VDKGHDGKNALLGKRNLLEVVSGRERLGGRRKEVWLKANWEEMKVTHFGVAAFITLEGVGQ
jgi:hypothetical protein